jgi:hypothetical protein
VQQWMVCSNIRGIVCGMHCGISSMGGGVQQCKGMVCSNGGCAACIVASPAWVGVCSNGGCTACIVASPAWVGVCSMHCGISSMGGVSLSVPMGPGFFYGKLPAILHRLQLNPRWNRRAMGSGVYGKFP